MSDKVRIYLDMDGVICNFPEKLQSIFGTSDYEELRHTVGTDKLWKELGQVDHLFLNLNPMPNYKTLFNYLQSLYDKGYVDEFEILTSLPHPTDKLHTAKQDKIDWVRKYLSKDIPVNTVIGGTEKAKYVKSKNDILVDDLTRNIEAWNKAGGTGIHFTNNATAIAEIDKLLKR